MDLSLKLIYLVGTFQALIVTSGLHALISPTVVMNMSNNPCCIIIPFLVPFLCATWSQQSPSGLTRGKCFLGTTLFQQWILPGYHSYLALFTFVTPWDVWVVALLPYQHPKPCKYNHGSLICLPMWHDVTQMVSSERVWCKWWDNNSGFACLLVLCTKFKKLPHMLQSLHSREVWQEVEVKHLVDISKRKIMNEDTIMTRVLDMNTIPFHALALLWFSN